MEKLNWSATQWPICFFRILRVVNWEQDEDIDVSKVVSSILNGKIPLSFDLSLVEVAVFKVFPILLQFLWFHCDDSARRKTNKRGWWIIKNFLFLYTTISIVSRIRFEGKDGLEIYNFNRTDGLDRIFRRKKILLNVTHVYVSRCNNKSKEVENRNFFRADRSNYRVKFDGGSEQIATTDGIRMVLEREGDEGITGNRKQTFGFIERGIVEAETLQIFDTRCSFRETETEISLFSLHPFLFLSARIFVQLSCVIQRRSIFILGKNANNEQDKLPNSIQKFLRDIFF